MCGLLWLSFRLNHVIEKAPFYVHYWSVLYRVRHKMATAWCCGRHIKEKDSVALFSNSKCYTEQDGDHCSLPKHHRRHSDTSSIHRKVNKINSFFFFFAIPVVFKDHHSALAPSLQKNRSVFMERLSKDSKQWREKNYFWSMSCYYFVNLNVTTVVSAKQDIVVLKKACWLIRTIQHIYPFIKIFCPSSRRTEGGNESRIEL